MPVPDFAPGEVLTAAAMDSIGLWRVTTCTVTSVGGTAATASNGVITVGTNNTSITIANAFSANFDSYRIIISGGTHSVTGENILMQLSGSTGSTYSTSGFFVTYGTPTVSAYAPAAGTTWLVGFFGGTNTAATMDVINPFLTKKTGFSSLSSDTYNYSFSGQNTATNSSTGFTLSPASGSVSAQKIRIYGYNNG